MTILVKDIRDAHSLPNGPYTKRLLNRAADEIERLTAEGANREALLDDAFVAITNYLAYPYDNERRSLEHVASRIGPPESRVYNRQSDEPDYSRCQCPDLGKDGHSHPANPCPKCGGTGSV